MNVFNRVAKREGKISKVDEEQFEPETEDVLATRAERSQARVLTTDNGGHQPQSGNGLLTTVLILFLVVITAGMSFLIYITMENEKKYDAMEKQLSAIEQRLPNTGQEQAPADESKLLQPKTSDSNAATSQSGVAGTEPSSGIAQPNPNGTKVYIVQSGDTLSTIATINGMTLEELRTLNNLTDDDVYMGQEITVTGTATE